MNKQYHTIALGGTFDHLHDGHKFFIKFATTLAENLVVAVTSDNYALSSSKPLQEQIESYKVRHAVLIKYLITLGIEFHTFTLEKGVSLTLTNYKTQALLATYNTLNGAQGINDSRTAIGLKSLPIHMCEMLEDSIGTAISSTRVRLGMINRAGEAYSNCLLEDLRISNFQHELLSERQGLVVLQPLSMQNVLRVVVGDVVLETFVKNNWNYNIGVFDRRSARTMYSSIELSKLSVTLKLQNSPGYITQQLSASVAQVIKVATLAAEHDFINSQPSHLLVEGEEDLAAVAAIFHAPLGTQIYYGQRGEGMVMMTVTEELKERMKRLFCNQN